MGRGTRDRIVDSGGGGSGGSVTQGTSPWVVSGTVVATQGTTPWVVSNAVLTDVHDAGNNALKVNVVAGGAGGGVVTQGTSPWVVSGTVAVTGTQTDALTDTQLRASPVPVSGTVAATQSTSPWVVSGTVTIQDGGNVITVDATALDIRSLTFAADKVDASGSSVTVVQSTHDNLNANANVQVGNADATVLNQVPTAFTVEPTTASDNVSNVLNMPLGRRSSDSTSMEVHFLTFPHVFDGSTWDRARGDSANGLDVDVTRLPAIPAGNNNIGDVDIATIAAGANEIGRVGSKLFNGTLKDNSGDDVTVKSAPVSFSTSGNGNNTVVAAVATKKIRVIGIWGYISDAASHIALIQDGAGGSTLFALKVSNGTELYNFSAAPGAWLFETTANTLLNLNLTQNVDSGFIRFSYIEVD